MNSGVSLALIATSVLVLAGGWIAVTRRSKAAPEQVEPIVVWMRPMDESVRHAFRTAELRFRVPMQALAFCDEWPTNELLRDDAAPRCAPCVRAVDALEDLE